MSLDFDLIEKKNKLGSVPRTYPELLRVTAPIVNLAGDSQSTRIYCGANGGSSSINYRWSQLTPIVLNRYAIPTKANGYCYKCTFDGTTGFLEPIWPTTPGLTVVDGSVTWECQAQVAATYPLEILFFSSPLRAQNNFRGFDTASHIMFNAVAAGATPPPALYVNNVNIENCNVRIRHEFNSPSGIYTDWVNYNMPSTPDTGLANPLFGMFPFAGFFIETTPAIRALKNISSIYSYAEVTPNPTSGNYNWVATFPATFLFQYFSLCSFM